MPMKPHSARRGHHGFSLIEVLIALIVLSLGLLGLAALQTNSLKFSQVAHLRSQASTFAYQMLDTMRASPTAANNGDFDIAISATAPTGATVPQTELAAWKNQLAALLPDGNGSVCRSVNPDPSIACTGAGDFTIITVQWNEADDTGARSARQIQLVSQVVQ